MSNFALLTAGNAILDVLDEAAYHAHPALSSSGARALLRCPARYAYERDHPKQPTRDMLLGTCVHTEVLGVGQDFDVLPGDDLRIKATREAAAEFEAAGVIALKPAEYAAVRGMTAAALAHPIVWRLFVQTKGAAERSIFWTDEATGVACRARIDWQPETLPLLVDLKTTGDASTDALSKHMASFGYVVQAAWYLQGAEACGLADASTGFTFVFVERDPPYLVTVVDPDPDDLEWAMRQCQRAREIFRDCTEAGTWPGYPQHQTVRLPPWARREIDPEEN